MAWLSVGAAIGMIVASLQFVITFKLADGVVIPNILVSSRGVFIVLISAVGARLGCRSLDAQRDWRIYGLRLAASLLIVLSIWVALQR
jgi:hypothetical protein